MCEETTARVFTQLIKTANHSRLEFFVSLGADIETNLVGLDVSSGTGIFVKTTPLTVAARLDNITLARLFLEKGANVYCDSPPAANDDDHSEPRFKFHAMHATQSVEMVHLLLDHGAYPDLPDHCGWNCIGMFTEATLRP
jgi:hypothetical protein